MNPIKPGVKTTEFWIALVVQVLPLLVMLGVIGPGDVSTLEGALTKAITAVGALAAAAWVIVEYIKGRVRTKTANGK